MAYNPTQGVIVDGRIIEAADLMNEFTAISVATKENAANATTAAAKAREEAIQHTDDAFAQFNIDGGTF